MYELIICLFQGMDHLKTKFTIYSFQTDFRGNAKIVSLCDYLQEAANSHALELGFSPKDLLEKGMFWALYRFSVRIFTYPIAGDSIVINTWVSSMKGPFSEREFELCDSRGNLIGEASTLWFAVNNITRKPQTIGNIGKSKMLAMGAKKMLGKPSKVKPISGARKIGTVQSNYSLLDENYHINNVRYIELLLSAIPLSKFREFEIMSIDINYLNEPPNDELLTINFHNIDNESDFISLLTESGKAVVSMNVHWRKIV